MGSLLTNLLKLTGALVLFRGSKKSQILYDEEIDFSGWILLTYKISEMAV